MLLARATWKDPAPALRGSGKAWKHIFKGVVVLRRSRRFRVHNVKRIWPGEGYELVFEWVQYGWVVWASCFHRFVLTLCPIVKSRTNFNLVYRSIRFQLFLNPIPEQTLFTSLLQTSLSVLMQFTGMGPAQQEYSSSLPSLSFSECVYRKWTESAVVALWVWTGHTATDWGADYGCYFGSTRKPFVLPLPFRYSPS